MYFVFQISVWLRGGGRGQTHREWLQSARKPAFQPLRENYYLKTSQLPVRAATRPFCGASAAYPAMFQGLAIQYPTFCSVKM